MHQIFRLQNGIKLIHREIDSPVSHFGILVNAGTRDEKPEKMGLAHFVEHTIFKGTKKRKNFQIIKRMEDVGGELNASTSKEETYFHSSFLSPDYERSIELLADIFFNSTFPEKEIEKEKSVIEEEIEYYLDSPAELMFDDFESLIFEGHPFAMNILGSKRTLKKLKREDIFDFIKQQYCLDNIVLASAGNISIKKLIQLCEKYFGNHPIAQCSRERLPFFYSNPKHLKVKKNTSQTHLMIGTTAYSIQNDEKKNAFTLLNNLLGGQGMYTRLNSAIREKHGWAYSIESNYSPFSDIGLFTIYAGCDHQNTECCIEEIFKVLDDVKKNKLGTLQLHYAKRQMIGQICISNETKLNEMLTLGRSALFFDEVESTEESLARIEEITAEEILEVANEIFDKDRFSSLIFTKK
ncbi:MAG: insulinase family protein [Bacteroidales bacterium]|nr:insulinase family protein [Bacteroidales bacterium]